jgi:hypothetical protein
MVQPIEAHVGSETSGEESRHSRDLLRMMASSVLNAHSEHASDSMMKEILTTKIHTAEALLSKTLTDTEAAKSKIRRYATVPISGELPESAQAAIAEVDDTIPSDERMALREHAIAVFRENFGLPFRDQYDQLCAEIVAGENAVAASETVTTAEIAVLLSDAYSHAV